MKLVHLKELASVTAGQGAPKNSSDFTDDGVPFVRAGSLVHLLDGELESSLELVAESTAKKYKLKLYPAGSVLFAKSGMSATKDRVYYLKKPAYVVSHLAIVVPHEDVDSSYLTYALRQFKPSSLIKDKAYPSINLPAIEKHKVLIPYKEDKPDLNEQLRIATLLRRVEVLIATRKKNLQQLDSFLSNTFLDMFKIRSGEYKSWPIDKLNNHTGIVSGVTKGKKYKNNSLVSVPYMRVANVQDGYFDLREIKNIEVTVDEKKRYALEKGDLLLTEGGDPDKLGRGSVWEGQIDECIHQNHIFRVRVKDEEELNPRYLSGLVGSVYGKAYFLKSAKQTTGIASINSTQLKNFPLILPPTPMQDKYAAINETVDAIKVRYQQNAIELENLYNALSQKAFKGELDLSRVPLPEVSERIVHERKLADHIPVADGVRIIEYPMSVPKEREKLLRNLFDEFLNQHKGSNISLDDFWDEASFKTIDLMDEFDKSWNAEDYDQVKEGLFELLREGKISQEFIIDENTLKAHGQIVLKVKG